MCLSNGGFLGAPPLTAAAALASQYNKTLMDKLRARMAEENPKGELLLKKR